VSTVTGNPVASAIRKMLALKLDGNTKNASGSQAVAGSGRSFAVCGVGAYDARWKTIRYDNSTSGERSRPYRVAFVLARIPPK
jgi:hypothetical protein